MITADNKGRLEQEIANLITFIDSGRAIFFRRTRLSLDSSDEFLGNLESMEIFQDEEMIQLDLNIQLFYIKLSSYYSLVSKHKVKEVKVPRNSFAHEHTDLIFNRRVPYNFFIYKVAKNFKKIAYLFYSDATDDVEQDISVRVLELDLDKDIKEFLTIWRDTTAKK